MFHVKNWNMCLDFFQVSCDLYLKFLLHSEGLGQHSSLTMEWRLSVGFALSLTLSFERALYKRRNTQFCL